MKLRISDENWVEFVLDIPQEHVGSVISMFKSAVFVSSDYPKKDKICHDKKFKIELCDESKIDWGDEHPSKEKALEQGEV